MSRLVMPLTKIVITGNKGGTGKTTIAALLTEYLTSQNKKRPVSSPPPIDYQIIDTAGSLLPKQQNKVYFLPNRYQKTKEQKEGLNQLNETRRDINGGMVLPPLSQRPALYGSLLNGNSENFFTKPESQQAQETAYQAQEISLNPSERDKFAPKREITVRFSLNPDLLNFYHSLPVGQRTAIIEESLRVYLARLGN
ncbi:665_t:CDS:2 [Funneliformis geosporum]|nr:665_t:CDS:2 [Funneliformis geosporum]